MRSFLVALATVSLVISAYTASPAADDMNLTPQQDKCNADASAKALKSDERKGFMSECLKGDKKM